MEKDLSEKVVLITGVGGGLGKTFLQHLINKVKRLYTSSRTSKSEILSSELITNDLSHIPMDLTKESNVKELFRNIGESDGRLDVLINTIGGSLYSYPLENFPLANFKEVFEVNLISAFLITREAIKIMKHSGGNIIHIVSSSAKRISKNKAPYGAAKSALATLIKYAAAETAQYAIKVNGITPTYVFTPRHQKEIKKRTQNNNIERKDLEAKIINSQLLKRKLFSEDLIPVVELLMKTEVITGQIYNVTLGEILSY
jgi:3-oxoacyl-[acyl-carrier protein] reductase